MSSERDPRLVDPLPVPTTRTHAQPDQRTHNLYMARRRVKEPELAVLRQLERFDYLSYRQLVDFTDGDLPDMRHRVRHLRQHGLVDSHPCAFNKQKLWRATPSGLRVLNSPVQATTLAERDLRDRSFLADFAATVQVGEPTRERLLTARQIMGGVNIQDSLAASAFRVAVVPSEVDPHASRYPLCPDLVLLRDLHTTQPRCQVYVFETVARGHLFAYRTMIRSYRSAMNVDRVNFVSPDSATRAIVRLAADAEGVGNFVALHGYRPSGSTPFVI